MFRRIDSIGTSTNGQTGWQTDGQIFAQFASRYSIARLKPGSPSLRTCRLLETCYSIL